MKHRWFTPASARRTLQHIRPAAERMYRLYREIELRRPLRVGSDQRVEPLYFAMVERLVRGLAALEGAGVRADDLRRGVLDYDHRHGYRGPEAYVALPAEAAERDAVLERLFQETSESDGIVPAVVICAVGILALVYANWVGRLLPW